MTRPALDVSELPTHAFGVRDTAWWGAMSVVAIESTMYVLLFASYGYIRQQYDTFPPTPLPRAVRVVGTLDLAAIVSSAWPMHLVCKHALTANVSRMRLWLLVNTALAIAVVAMRIVELRWLTFRWDSHAHGSAVWTLLGLHFFHAASGVIENFVFLAILFQPWRLEKKHLADLRLNGLYWYFVVGAFLVIYPLVFLDPVFFARHAGP